MARLAAFARGRLKMLAKRIIPCLDVTGGRVVKGVNFVELRDVGDPQAMPSDQELEEAAEAIQLKEVLESLPLRWKTPVNEYSRDLSLGQLQLFKISRVLLRPYSIVISDEPTCHLPEDLHLKALATINQNCSLHLSAIHRSSGFAQFESFLLIQPDGSITVQAEPPS